MIATLAVLSVVMSAPAACFAQAGCATPDRVADRFLLALEEGDDVTLRAIAADPQVDPYLVAGELLWRAGTGGADEAARLLSAAGVLAELTADDEAESGLAELVEAWGLLDGEELAGERRMRSAFAGIRRAKEAEEWERAVRLFEELEHEAEAPHSLAGPLVLLEGGRALVGLGRMPAAAEAFRRSVLSAERLGWTSMQDYTLYETVRALTDLGRYEEARAAAEQRIAICERAGFRASLSGAWNALATVHNYRGELDEALAAYERALVEANASGRRDMAARTLGNIGLVLRYRGELERALEAQREALGVLEELGEDRSAALRRIEIGEVFSARGQFEEALVELERARQGLERYRPSSDHAHVLRCLGTASFLLERASDAREWFQLALAEAEGLGDRRTEGAALTGLGQVHRTLRQYDRALEYQARALAVREALGNRLGAAWTRTEMAAVHDARGDYAEALSLFDRALAELEELQVFAEIGRLVLMKGSIYSDLGLRDAAQRCFVECLDLSERVGDEFGKALAHARLGELALGSEAFDEAQRHFEESRATVLSLGLPGAGELNSLGDLHSRQGRHEEALDIYRKARAESAEYEDPRATCYAAAAIGRELLHLGRTETALEELDGALAELRQIRERGSLADTLFARAEAHRRLGDLSSCLEDVRAALEVRMALARGLGDRESRFLRGETRRCAEFGLLNLAVLDEDERSRRLPFALWLAETSRALLLAEVLANPEALLDAEVSPELALEHAERRARAESRSERLRELARTKGAAPEVLAAARAELDAAYAELEEVVARVEREARRAAQVAYPQPIELARLQAALEPETALVSYQLIESACLALVVRRDGAELVTLGAGEELAREVRRYVKLASIDRSAEAGLAARLYAALLAPLEGALAGASRLLLCPDGALAFLPLEALVGAGDSGDQRAIERWEIGYVPSGTVYASLRAEASAAAPGGAFLALGDPLYPGEDLEAAEPENTAVTLRGLASLRRLPGTGDEVRALGALFAPDETTLLLRAEASEANLERQLRGGTHRLAALHLACHGVLDAAHPRLSGLVLAGGEVLTLDEVYRLHIRADLAVLSACDSGRGELVYGEGVMGLVRGFFFAGVPRVVVSNWKVDDARAKELLVAFYRRMREDGLAPAAALRAAKLERLGSGGELAHPYHWAGFVLWGLPD